MSDQCDSKHVEIRSFQHQDLPALVALYNEYILRTPATFDLEPYTIDARRDSWLAHFAERGPYRLLVADCGGEAVGYVSSSCFNKKAAYDTSVETSVYVSTSLQGRGLGTALYQSLFDCLKTEDIHRAYAGITLPNEASVRLHEKLGFCQVGVFREVGRKFDQYWDVAWFQRDC